MKKRFSMAILATAIAVSASAQLSVVEKGHVHIGTLKSGVTADADSKLVILGNSSNNLNGRIAFGDGDHVLVGEDQFNNFLALKGDNGLKFRMGKTTYFTIFTPSGVLPQVPRAAFETDVWANGFITPSDLRLKTNVRPLGDRWHLLSDVNTISYTRLARPLPQRTKTLALKDSVDITEQETPAAPDDRMRYGFAAQEIRELFPELVSEDEDGFLSVDYLGFIPLLVDAYKNLAERNHELEDKVEALLHPVKKTVSAEGVTSLFEVAKLSQNRPNPFNESTIIDITLPEGVSSAMLCVYDLQGTQMMQLPVENRGKTSVSIQASALRPGMYLYTLIADGQELDTKRMILTE